MAIGTFQSMRMLSRTSVRSCSDAICYLPAYTFFMPALVAGTHVFIFRAILQDMDDTRNSGMPELR